MLSTSQRRSSLIGMPVGSLDGLQQHAAAAAGAADLALVAAAAATTAAAPPTCSTTNQHRVNSKVPMMALGETYSGKFS